MNRTQITRTATWAEQFLAYHATYATWAKDAARKGDRWMARYWGHKARFHLNLYIEEKSK